MEQNLIFLNLFLIYMYSIVGDLRFKNVKLLSLPWALTAGIVGGGGGGGGGGGRLSVFIVEVSGTCVERWRRVRWRITEVWQWNLKVWFA